MQMNAVSKHRTSSRTNKSINEKYNNGENIHRYNEEIQIEGIPLQIQKKKHEEIFFLWCATFRCHYAHVRAHTHTHTHTLALT